MNIMEGRDSERMNLSHEYSFFLESDQDNIDFLVGKFPNVDRRLIEQYLSLENDSTRDFVTKSDLLRLVLFKEDGDLAEYFTENDPAKMIFKARVHFLSEVSLSSFEAAVKMGRSGFLHLFAYEYFLRGKNIPPKLSLMMTKDDTRKYQEILSERESIKDGFRNILARIEIYEKERVAERSNKAAISDVHPRISDRAAKIEDAHRSERVVEAISVFERKQDQLFEQIEHIIETYTDPRHVYDEIIDVNAAINLIGQV